MSELVGYARVSTADQDPELQRQALEAAGCSRVFVETASGAVRDRPVLEEALRYLRPGDVLVVWKLDRLGRSLRHLLEVVHGLAQRDVGFRSLTEGLDTTTPAGRLLFHVVGALAEFERDLIRERTHAGIRAAAANGRRGGRPSTVGARQLRTARQLLDGGATVTEAAASVGVSRPALYRALSKAQPSSGAPTAAASSPSA